MTNQERVAAVAAAVRAQFAAVELLTGPIQDSVDQADPSWKLTVYVPQTGKSLYFRAGKAQGWLWDHDADIVLPALPQAAITLTLAVVGAQVPAATAAASDDSAAI